MSDYDRRQGNNRKRRFREEDDYERNDRRGPRRREQNHPPHIRLRRALLVLADSSPYRWQDESRIIANIIKDHYEESTEVRTTFNELLGLVVIEQPLRIPFVAYVIMLVNVSKPEIVKQIVSRVSDSMQEKLKLSDWRGVKLFLRVLACLQPILTGEGIFPFLDELFVRAGALQSASSEDTIGTEIVKIILLTLPYLMSFDPEAWKDKASALMEQTDIIASEPHPFQSLVDPILGDNGTETGKAASTLALLQKQLQSEAEKNWPLTIMPRPWIDSSGDVDMKTKIEGSEKHDTPSVAVPETLLQGPDGIYPEMWFSVYSGQEIDTVPSTDSIASVVIRDVCLDTIYNLDFNRYWSARIVICVDNYFSHGTFARRETPYDHLRELDAGQSTWKPEDVIVDTVFSRIFHLPVSERKQVYYHSVLTEACKIAPAAIAPSLGRAIRYLYRNTANMDLELSQRFVEWFAHHLSNFGFTWKWQEWVDDVEFPESHPRKSFIIGAIDHEIRLSFSQRIKGTLPEVYRPLINRATEDDEPEYKFNNEDTPLHAEGVEVANLLRKKTIEEDEFQPIIEKIQTSALDIGVDPLVSSADVLMTAVCYIGSKSLSHGIACLERAHNKLAEFAEASEAARDQILSSIATYWSFHPGFVVALIDRLLATGVISPLAVVSWAITTPSLRESEDSPAAANLSRSLVFELVIKTVERVILRLHKPLEASPFAPTEESLFELLSTIKELVAKIPADDAEGVDSVQTWQRRWQRVFDRKAAHQKMVIAEKKAEQEIKAREEEALLKEAEADIQKAAAEAEAEE